MQKYKNLYYTLDTTNLTTLTDTAMGFDEVLFFPNGNSDDSAGKFLQKLRENRTELLAEAKRDWLGLFDVAPDRIFWGTDVALEWHTEQSVYQELISFSKEFSDSLPEQLRKAYMYSNALAAFGEGQTLQPLSEAEFEVLDNKEDN